MAPPLSLATLKPLRGSLTRLLLATCLGAGVLTAARDRDNQIQHEAQRLSAESRDLHHKLSRLQEEENELRRAIAGYGRLESRGIVGPEQRWAWLATLDRIRQDRKLPDLQYELAAQRPVDIAAPSTRGLGAQWKSSTMTLRLNLLHEEDLLHLLDDLAQAAPAFVRPRRCDLSRLPIESAPTLATLRAECQLDWITLEDAR
ncbi:hypothetical protein DLREEDagrD3_23020 [Denitratisoma sp. agr-D3]